MINKVIQGLWIGPELSLMEQLSIASFLMNGHEYHLYIYDDMKGIPAGTTIKDGREILPPSMIFQYEHFKTYAGFANFFRYKLLLEKGGWWADTDTICLKPFDFAEEYIFSSELCQGEEVINNGIIKAPAASDVMAYAWQVSQTKDPAQLVWGELGPKLMAEAVRAFALERFVQPHHVFCPLHLLEWDKVLIEGVKWEFDQDTYAIHLWNEFWRRHGQDKNRRYPANCLYEQLKAKYLG